MIHTGSRVELIRVSTRYTVNRLLFSKKKTFSEHENNIRTTWMQQQRNRTRKRSERAACVRACVRHRQDSGNRTTHEACGRVQAKSKDRAVMVGAIAVLRTQNASDTWRYLHDGTSDGDTIFMQSSDIPVVRQNKYFQGGTLMNETESSCKNHATNREPLADAAP